MSDHSSGDERHAVGEESYARKKRDDRKDNVPSRRDDRERDRFGYDSDNIKRRHHRHDSDSYGDYRTSRRDARYDDDDGYSSRSRSRSRSRGTGRSPSRTRSRSRSRQRELERREEEPRVSGDELDGGSDRGVKEWPKDGGRERVREGRRDRDSRDRAKEKTQRKNGWGQKGRTHESYDNRNLGSGRLNHNNGEGYQNRGFGAMDGPREPWKPDISTELVITPSDIFQGCNLHICKSGYPRLPINTLDLVKTHGGKLCPDPSARHCNYVVIPLSTNLPANTVLPIDRHLPNSQYPVLVGDQRPGSGWHIEGLVRFFSRVVGPVPPDEHRRPKIVLRQEWLVDCVRVGRILGEEDGWAGWEVKSTYDPKLVFTTSPHPVPKDNLYEQSPHHSNGGGPADIVPRVNGGGGRMHGDYQRRDSGMRRTDLGWGRDEDNANWRVAGENTAPPEFIERGDAKHEQSYQSPSVTPSFAARVQPPVIVDESALSNKFTPIASFQRVELPAAPVPDYSYPDPIPAAIVLPKAEHLSTFRPSPSATPSQYAPVPSVPAGSYTPVPVHPVPPPTMVPAAAQHPGRLFSVAGIVAMTFCIEGPPISRKTTEMLIRRTGGGVIAPRDRAMFVVFPIAKGEAVVEPEYLAIMDELASDPTRTAISQDWVMECIEADALVPMTDFVAQATATITDIAPTAVPAVPGAAAGVPATDTMGQKRRAEEELRERVKRSMLDRHTSEEKTSAVPPRPLGGALDLRGVQENHQMAMEAVIKRLRGWQQDSGWTSLLEVLGISAEPVEMEHQLRYIDDLFQLYGKELALNISNFDVPGLMTLWAQNLPDLS